MSKNRKLKLLSNISSFVELNKQLQEIEKRLNELGESTAATPEEPGEEDGKIGDIRISPNADKSYTFLIKTEDGWKTPVSDGGASIKFTDVPNTRNSLNEKKSIDEIESEDSNTEETNAQKTIYDEKADKFVIARPDFDSGWQTWTRADHDTNADSPLKIEHGLEVLPTMIIGYFAPGQAADSVTYFTPIKNGRGYNYDNGVGLFVDDTRVYLYAGDNHSLSGIPAPSTTSNCDGTDWEDGSVRVLIWK
jgi:hypothetical protein